jgi:hypothetical protein
MLNFFLAMQAPVGTGCDGMTNREPASMTPGDP